jgi:hypothetical protein
MVRLPAGYHRAAGGWPRGWRVPAGTMVPRVVQPVSLPPRMFRTPVQVPIGPEGFAQGIVAASGVVILSVGPAGAGTSWDLAQVSVSTTTGAADASTVSFTAQPSGFPSDAWQVGQSYAGGGDQVGLPGLKLVPGERFYAVWAGGTPGDTAIIILSGTKTVLT